MMIFASIALAPYIPLYCQVFDVPVYTDAIRHTSPLLKNEPWWTWIS